MSLADIQAATRQVVASGALSEAWQYRLMTSSPATDARTYGSWLAIRALCTGRTMVQEYDDRGRGVIRREQARLRVSDASTALRNGDQVQDPAGSTWAVLGVASQSTGSGTVAYTIERAARMVVSPDRGGSV